MRNGMLWQHAAVSDGVPIKGNFYWSAMDTSSGSTAMATASGSCTSTSTQKRIPKLSAQWFREAAARNAVV